MKKAILTIDDAPSFDFENKLAVLKEYRIPAIFFCTGSLIHGREDSLVGAIQNGFILGNHSYNHFHFSKISLKECERQIVKTSILLDNVYKMAGMERPVKWFRFPYGDNGDGRMGNIFKGEKKRGKAKKDAIQKILLDQGYTFAPREWFKYPIFAESGTTNDIDWMWTFDIMEWSMFMNKPMMNLSSVDQILKRMEDSHPLDCRGDWKDPHWLGAPDSPEVILTHDHTENAAVFESSIHKLISLGFEFPGYHPTLAE